ncbi:hypothetical protein D3C75_1022140 [compost metagenome]
MRNIDDRLDHIFEHLVPDLIKHQRQNNRQRKKNHDIQRKQNQRILQQHKKGGLCKQPNKMLESDPGTARDPEERLVILKSDDQPAHRQVLKNYKIQKSRKYH